MDERRETSGGAFRLPGMSRRSSLTAVKSLVALVLLFLVVAIASGLFSSGGNSSNTTSGAAAASPSSASAKPTSWGAEKTYIGRYRLLGATEQSHNAPSATRLTNGELTLFMREEHKNAPPIPSGILSLHAPAPLGTELLYLTSLTLHGATYRAVINGGAFVGPVVGSLRAVFTAPGKLTMTAEVQGVGTIHARFSRFSDSPQP
jgi:hypothetical protein